MKIINQWNEADSEFIRKKVIEYNLEKIPAEVKHPVKKVSFMIRNEKKEIVGGITGTIFWYCLHIEFLWIDKSIRGNGYGKKLLHKIEDLAIANNCKSIQLDTFSFQAPEFYQKNGYQIIGLIKNHPYKEMQQYFLEKKLM
ncbi:GNAT family N-acetyltransferase [Niallia sp. 03190]|uniref:GNAT family N-acetyltransferase n=1 Tax=Niallia sp. 03190 TaxID=3458061 RepID=UPI004044B8BC